MVISWTNPVTYPVGTTFRIRVEPFKNGQHKNIRVRVRDLPPTITSFTLEQYGTNPFNHSGVDQLRLRVFVRGANSTTAVTEQGYDFDAVAGTLTLASIGPRPYDINNDGQTGLAESIDILRNLAN